MLQLPVPPPGPEPIEGNVPLAGAYLKLHARRQGLEQAFPVELLPPVLANTLGDQALVEEVLARKPWMVGCTCYVWNIERTLWIARQLKRRQPEIKIILGGPEITRDNAWVLEQTCIDHAVLGEGEAAFVEFLGGLLAGRSMPREMAASEGRFPLDAVSSPYVEGIVDLGDERRMLLETVRGCRFRCKYCYYPKNFDTIRYLADEPIAANLRYAIDHGAREVVLLDPTLNQRPNFAEFLRFLAKNNPDRQLAFSGELRAEGIDAETAQLLRAANFHEVEIGLQSVEPRAWSLMGRPTNLDAFQRGVHAMIDEGIKVQVDLILGLPGDTSDSVRRGIEFLQETRAYSQAQVFNLSILPGTVFRRDAQRLGLVYQPWPPYYVLKTPTLDILDMHDLMEESQEAFGVEFDPLPTPQWDVLEHCNDASRCCRIDLDAETNALAALPASPAVGFAIWLRSADFHSRRNDAAAIVGQLLDANPHTTLQVILEPTAEPSRLTVETLELLLATCYRTPTYLDRYYSLHPGKLLGAKRLLVLLEERRATASMDWRRCVADYATLVVREQ